MLHTLKRVAKFVLPKSALTLYHRCLAATAAVIYRYPSEQLMVIGVTGTKGKSTTANLIAQLLETTGHRVGLTSTAVMKVAEREWLSDTGMTMPGRFRLQRLLRQMVSEGCDYAVVETSSEGIAQSRHRGIHYDVVVMTNFFPEHIEAHGSYERYRAAKGRLFEHLRASHPKVMSGRTIPKRVVLNRDDQEYDFFRAFQAGEEWTFGLGATLPHSERDLNVQIGELSATQSVATINGRELTVPLLFAFNVLNVAAALAACRACGIGLDVLFPAVGQLRPVPGRQEFIDEGQPFKVMVDYTYEPNSMRALYQHLSAIPHARVIHLLGPTGGGRDRWRRPVMGEIAARNADVVIATTDDPYDDDPNVLAEELLAGARPVVIAGRPVTLRKIIDRRAAIRDALEQAAPGDLVLVTGRGAEQKMALANGRYLPWDDRVVVREELRLLGGKI